MYYKTIDGKNVYNNGKAVEINGVWVSNPTEEMLLADGWQVYVPARDRRAEVVVDCEQYAESLKVVNFQGEERWLTPNERANYKNALEAAEAVGVSSIPIFGATLTPAQGLAVLRAVEVYAMQVTLREKAHEAAIAALDEGELDGYDYKTGYPEKLTF